MAEEELQVDEEKQAGKKKKFIILGSAGALVLLLGIGGAFFFLGGEEESAQPSAPVAVKSIYFKLDKPFIVNFQAAGRQRYLQIDVTVKSKNQAAINMLQKHAPVIKNDLNQLFGDQTQDSLQAEGGRVRLNEAATASVQAFLQKEMGTPGIEQVLFTDFVMQ